VKPIISDSVKAFSSFDPKLFLAAKGIRRRAITLRKGEKIFSRDDEADFIAQVKTGSVALSTPSGNKSDQFVSNFGEGEFFGEECLTGEPRRKGTAYATGPAVVFIVKKDVFLRLLRQDPELSHHFIAYLLARNARIEKHLVDVARGTGASLRPPGTGPSRSRRRPTIIRRP
jgi:CRP/FNR family transcriptional regulator, cyclic AMP receptor protein